jgi:hypothetical protein
MGATDGHDMADFFNHGIGKKSLYLMHFQDNRFLSHVERFFYLKKKELKKKKTRVVTILTKPRGCVAFLFGEMECKIQYLLGG